MKTSTIINLEDRYQLHTYNKFPIVLVKGSGVKVWDAEGKEYTDLYGGHAVTILGHCHPALVDAIKKQSERLLFYSNAVYSDTRAKASRRLIKVTPKGLNKVFFCNSGTEANETALKLARKYTGKSGIIAMKEGFHGRTIGSLSVTGIEKYRTQFTPVIEGTRLAEFGNMDSIKAMTDDNTGAIILEPIQSMAGIRTASYEFFQELKSHCEEHDMVLIFDEVQTGFGRTGKMFASQYYNVTPDIITCAKGIAGGFPMGAVILSEKIADTVSYGEHGSTFGGGPLACATLDATIKTILLDELLDNVNKIGEHIFEKLSSLDGIQEIRGVGLLRGFKMNIDAKTVQSKLLDKGIIVGTAVSEPDVIRVMPSLIIDRANIDEFYSCMEQILKETN